MLWLVQTGAAAGIAWSGQEIMLGDGSFWSGGRRKRPVCVGVQLEVAVLCSDAGEVGPSVMLPPFGGGDWHIASALCSCGGSVLVA
mmetsp:Transcript_49513/g.130503  ORF Transcript_49513/g.130503 Transcript_49513/m.130503 type:complete len:86 (+) Transcript_49513:48-305(+)